ncbi:MAG: hypothetical protein Q4P66_06665 [Actinomycetaceae bacterium]|nr:hypothetical protein [Actinomycetaceae bacterium]
MAANNAPVARWRVQEGAMVAPQLNPDDLCDQLHEFNVVAEVDWFKQTPHLVGINVLVNKAGGVAALDDEDGAYRAGITTEELTKRLAEEFYAEVTIGEHTANHIKEDAVFPNVPDSGSEEVRVCEVSAIPEASVPFCAAAESKDMGCLDIGADMRAVFYSTTLEQVREGIMATLESPCIALYAKPHDFSMASVVADDKGFYPESLLLHSWMLNTRMITGAVSSPSEKLRLRVRADLGHGHVAEQTAEVFDYIDEKQLLDATRTFGRDGFMQAIKALGLPSEIAAFLFGHIGVGSVPGARLYPAQGWTEAFGQSMDIKLTEPEPAGSLFWRIYRKATIDKPWIARGIAIAESITGTILATAAFREKKPRTGWTKLGGALGIFLVVDAIAQISLAQYLSGRAKRHRAQREN